MLTVFEETNRGHFKRDSIVSKSSMLQMEGCPQNQQVSAPAITLSNGVPDVQGEVIYVQNYIRLDKVPIVTPNCDIVVPSLTLTVSDFLSF